jgi:excisionase family DNA binding protein
MRENEHFRETLADIRLTFGEEVKMLTVQQVGDYLNCDRRTVSALIRKCKLSATDINPYGKNSTFRVPVEALARFITKKEK